VTPDIIPVAAREARERAGVCIDERRFVDAIEHAETAAALCPDWPSPWWILSVGYKHARRWQDALDASERAIALDPDDCAGPRWNAGIAATALGLWPRARAAWAGFGVKLPAGDGPIEMDLGATPIRVSLDESPEVVWTTRIDPCRARIRSIPLPESGRRYDDLVLHDGEARGKRRFGDRSVSVFDEIELLQPSAFETWQLVMWFPGPEEHQALMRELEDDEVLVEDWSDNYEILCEACSLGEPHAHDDLRHRNRPWDPEHRMGVAVRGASELGPLLARLALRGKVMSADHVL
jgi:hypothetical protein